MYPLKDDNRERVVDRQFARAKQKTARGRLSIRLSKCDAASVADLLNHRGHPTRVVGREADSVEFVFSVQDEGDGVVVLYVRDDRCIGFVDGVLHQDPMTPQIIQTMDGQFALIEPLLKRAGLSAERLEGYEGEPQWTLTHENDKRSRE